MKDKKVENFCQIKRLKRCACDWELNLREGTDSYKGYHW
jgi:hypothetical protein